MDADTLVHLVSQRKHNTDRFFFQDDEAWQRVFQQQCLNQATSGIEKQISSQLNELVDLSVDTGEKMTTLKEQDLQEEHGKYVEIERALNELWVIRAGFQEVQVLREMGELSQSLASLGTVEAKLEAFDGAYPNTELSLELKKQAETVSAQIMAQVDEAWEKAIEFDNGVSVHAEDSLPLESIYSIVETADAGKHRSRKEILLQKVDDQIVSPILDLKVEQAIVSDEQKNSLKFQYGRTSTLRQLKEILETSIQFLNDSFNGTAAESIKKRFSSSILQRLTNKTLPELFPADPSKLDMFEMELKEFVSFEMFLQDLGWTKGDELRHWVVHFNEAWVTTRKLHYLDRIRSEIQTDLDTARVEESVRHELETPRESVPEPEPRKEEDDWNNEWDEEDDEDENEQDNDSENWGWGDEDDEDHKPIAPKSATKKHQPHEPHHSSEPKHHKGPEPAQESNAAMEYTVTHNVEKLMGIISDFAQEMKKDEVVVTKHVGDLLSFFRALSPVIYESQLVQYNDGLLLLQELPLYVPELDREKLKQHVQRCFNGIVDEKQELLLNAIRRANGFRDCSPNYGLQQCQTAIDQSCQILRDSFEEWRRDANFPTVCRMVAMLTETLVTSIMSSIEAQDDISEIECNELSSLIKQVSDLDKLFQDPTSSESDEQTTSNIAAFYVPSWIKFQYFGELLQSKLVDIMFLYNSSVLMDFSATELIGIVKSLFAESEHRKRAIEDILRGPQGGDLE